MKKIILLTLIALFVALGLAALLRAFVLPAGFNWAAVLPSVVAMLTNDERTTGNVGELRVSERLTRAAQAKAEDMAAKGYFSHVSPDGTPPWYWILKEEYLYRHAGENLAVNFEDSDEVVEAWMASPSHRFNILKPEYTEIGIGTATGTYMGDTAVFVVQMFGAPAQTYAGPLTGKCPLSMAC